MALRILLVDDHQMMRDGLRAILEKVDDYSVVGEAGSGREAVQLVAGRMITEASGNVSLETVRGIAEAGVDIISSGALTHSVKALDLGLDFHS